MQVTSTDFKAIAQPNMLIEYLKSSRRLENVKSIHHFTKLESIINIIQGGYWILKNPLDMNDMIEIDHWPKENQQKVYFISFMKEQKESIGMWSMYAQPWEQGVKVSITKKAIRAWIDSIDKIFYADPKTYFVDEKKYYDVSKRTKPYLAAVAYTNFEDKNADEEELLSCGEAHNTVLHNIYSNPELVGFIKNSAWDYEKEIRLRIDSDINYPALALKITEDLISGITITKGPRFTGDLENEIKKKIHRNIAIDKSLFFRKIKDISCDHCEFKQL